uniref:Uncharacterized protein n=1 Tax=Glossina pallidipes TaxID=7398 RepID=A0A1B0A020_GLOPL
MVKNTPTIKSSSKAAKSSIVKIPISTARFEHIRMVDVGPLPSSHNTYATLLGGYNLPLHRLTKWTKELAIVLLAFRSTYKEDNESNPAEKVFRHYMRLTGKIVPRIIFFLLLFKQREMKINKLKDLRTDYDDDDGDDDENEMGGSDCFYLSNLQTLNESHADAAVALVFSLQKKENYISEAYHCNYVRTLIHYFGEGFIIMVILTGFGWSLNVMLSFQFIDQYVWLFEALVPENSFHINRTLWEAWQA